MGCYNSKILEDPNNGNDNKKKSFKCQIDDLPDKFSFMRQSKNRIEEEYLDDISFNGEDAVM